MYTLKKSLGQHFLRDENISRKIVAAIREHAPLQREGGWPLLEVGPGAGAITKYLLELEGVDFKAVELDEEKLVYLKKTYPSLEGKLIHRSILDMDRPFEGPFTVAGNFPYNISSQILFKILDWKDDVEAMTGMFQKEVALRIAAKEGSKVYGVLSVLVQAFFDVEYLFEVNEQCFNPPPKVRSAVIRLLPRKERPSIRKEEYFFRLVKMAFNQRRKTLRNAVRGLFEPNQLSEEIFNLRAEQLSVEKFAELTWKMQ